MATSNRQPDPVLTGQKPASAPLEPIVPRNEPALDSVFLRPRLDEILLAESYRFEFFAAVRILGLLSEDRKPVGGDADPVEETVRFRSHQSLSFPASEIVDISATGSG